LGRPRRRSRRRQRVAEFAQELAARTEERAARDSQQERELASTRLLNERFTTAAGQLGDDKPAVRLAGVYAMAGLADDWPQQRQTCVDVLCAYLRMPYEPDPGDEAPPADRQTSQALRHRQLHPQFTGSTVDFQLARDWSVPPQMPSWETPPPGVLLPTDQH
jgi:hypothetical protein